MWSRCDWAGPVQFQTPRWCPRAISLFVLFKAEGAVERHPQRRLKIDSLSHASVFLRFFDEARHGARVARFRAHLVASGIDHDDGVLAMDGDPLRLSLSCATDQLGE